MTTFGLLLILTGWLLQLYSVWQGQRDLKPGLLILYGLGVTGLVIDGFLAGFFFASWLNLTVVFFVALILLLLSVSRFRIKG
jgi:hypothetical protein